MLKKQMNVERLKIKDLAFNGNSYKIVLKLILSFLNYEKSKKIGKILKIPFKFLYQVGSCPIKFVYNRRKKLIKIISPSNVKIVGVKISKSGKRIIITSIFIVGITSSSKVETQSMSRRVETLVQQKCQLSV